ncbi:hypothetical protein GDO86_001167 [Hymenochirus boettgeri]|uniref:beta-N-acetylhexosaminidase n=1 Tax=Hymenochirus boettgeri TaxID=247094 RepID=A0A8T2KG32_9PIPI|nr:hypothetical protein GDO86_001167 [Hymenochirus boettgeri]
MTAGPAPVCKFWQTKSRIRAPQERGTYVLKHNHYKFLREVEQYPNSINPHREETMPLLKKILTQVLDMHPMASFLHIGADEVFHLGEGQDSKSWMNSNNGDLGKMFLNHIKVVADFLKRQYPDKYLIMWDDMLRKIDVETIKEAKISQYVSPVLWKYRPDIRTEEIEQLLSRYQDCGFTSIWFASAFKGASEPDQIWTPIKMHMDNHLSWKKIIDSMNKFPKIRYSGIALTGWQR